MTRRRFRQRSRAHLYAAIALLTGALAAAIALRPKAQPEPAEDWGHPVAQAVQADLHYSARPVRVALHAGCRIARFGLHPWASDPVWTQERRDATHAALRYMGLSDEAALRAAALIETGAPDDVIGMTNLGAVGQRGATYRPGFATTYKSAGKGRVACVDSRTAFADDAREEYALVWRVRDDAGHEWHVGFFLRCANVSVFVPGPMATAPREGVRQATHFAPEPGTLWLALAALPALMARRK